MSTVEAGSSDSRGLKTMVMVATSTEDGRNVRWSMRSVYPATYVSDMREVLPLYTAHVRGIVRSSWVMKTDRAHYETTAMFNLVSVTV